MNREARRLAKRRARHAVQARPANYTISRLGFLTGRNIAIGAVALVVVGVIVLFVLNFRGSADVPGQAVSNCLADDPGSAVDSAPCRRHLPLGEAFTNYSTNPPTTGPHAESPVLWGVYSSPPFPTKEELVHNMEHGGVVIWYRPENLIPAQLDELTKKVAGWLKDERKKVVLTAFDEMDTPLALTHWGRIQKLDSYDLVAIDRFVNKLEGPGPEENIPFTDPIVLPPGY